MNLYSVLKLFQLSYFQSYINMHVALVCFFDSTNFVILTNSLIFQLDVIFAKWTDKRDLHIQCTQK